ncbi:E3 ubiquitin-protein ligase BRE1A-like [Onthophagus taurus]|uniref:E3 ubiquitin-protein ligase BRE1A-like n=1 Tax=Onthophagus taurus TaxID=166361 RepID=UPI0039BEB7B0
MSKKDPGEHVFKPSTVLARSPVGSRGPDGRRRETSEGSSHRGEEAERTTVGERVREMEESGAERKKEAGKKKEGETRKKKEPERKKETGKKDEETMKEEEVRRRKAEETKQKVAKLVAERGVALAAETARDVDNWVLDSGSVVPSDGSESMQMGDEQRKRQRDSDSEGERDRESSKKGRSVGAAYVFGGGLRGSPGAKGDDCYEKTEIVKRERNAIQQYLLLPSAKVSKEATAVILQRWNVMEDTLRELIVENLKLKEENKYLRLQKNSPEGVGVTGSTASAVSYAGAAARGLAAGPSSSGVKPRQGVVPMESETERKILIKPVEGSKVARVPSLRRRFPRY